MYINYDVIKWLRMYIHVFRFWWSWLVNSYHHLNTHNFDKFKVFEKHMHHIFRFIYILQLFHIRIDQDLPLWYSQSTCPLYKARYSRDIYQFMLGTILIRSYEDMNYTYHFQRINVKDTFSSSYKSRTLKQLYQLKTSAVCVSILFIQIVCF